MGNGIDAPICVALEIEWNALKKALDLVIVYPEQMADKIRSWCNRVANIVFAAIYKEMAVIIDDINKIRDIVLNFSPYKKIRRVCMDMMQCEKAIQLLAGKTQFGNKTVTELQNPNSFLQYVCYGKWTEWLQEKVSEITAIVNAYVEAIRTYIDIQVQTGLEWLLAQYRTIKELAQIETFIEKMDAYAKCIFGLCDIGATVTNYKSDMLSRLLLNGNGQIDRSAIDKLLSKGTNLIDNGITSLNNSVSDLQDSFNTKIGLKKKSDIAH